MDDTAPVPGGRYRLVCRWCREASVVRPPFQPCHRQHFCTDNCQYFHAVLVEQPQVERLRTFQAQLKRWEDTLTGRSQQVIEAYEHNHPEDMDVTGKRRKILPPADDPDHLAMPPLASPSVPLQWHLDLTMDNSYWNEEQP